MYNENEDDDFSESQIDENWALVYEYSREYEKKNCIFIRSCKGFSHTEPNVQ